MGVSDDFDALLDQNRERWNALQPLDDALRNVFRPPYLPSEDATKLAVEYNQLVQRSELNLLRLVVDALIDRLQVVGFREDKGDRPHGQVWDWWQESALDQRQVLVHRDAASYGDGFVLVTPGEDSPRITPESPLLLAVEYDPYDPSKVLRAGKQIGRKGWLYLPDEIISLQQRDDWNVRWEVVDVVPNPSGMCPVVRFANNLDSAGRSMSEVAGVLSVQERIHQTVFDRLLLQRSQAWRQRWASGITIDRDENGQPINPFELGADRILIGDNPDVKFGEFSQADITGLLRAIDDDLQAVALISRTPPHYLPSSSISNISGETLAALEAALESKVRERQQLWGESWEQAMRIGGAMVGVEIGSSAETVWAREELLSEAQRVDAATKLASIGIPMEYILERMSLTPQEIERVMNAYREQEATTARAQAQAFGVELGGVDDAAGA